MAKKSVKSGKADKESKGGHHGKSAKESKGKQRGKSAKDSKKSNPRQTAFAVKLPPSVDERESKGKDFRNIVSRKDHSFWAPSAKRRDPIAIIEESNRGRFPDLIPIRYGRMLKSAFTFFRGSAALMAADLATTPTTGIFVQACGDCHLLNFGAYATPERNLIVDINDFDETLPGPWEWDLKRLATSFVLAGRANGFKEQECKEAAETVGRAYREAMEEFAREAVLDVWYSKMDFDEFVKRSKDEKIRQEIVAQAERARERSVHEYIFPKLTVEEDGGRRFKDEPPLLYHAEEMHSKKFAQIAIDTFHDYRKTLSDDKRVMLDRYQLMDVAVKVVGIGSVGTFCAIMLLLAGPDDPLILQLKQANASVLEPYVGKSKYANHGQRVVNGQRLMQTHSDIFLGWATGTGKGQRHFYVRQLKDMKMGPVPETWTAGRAIEVADTFGWVLARAHARSGDPATIAGYLGSKDVFDKALADFAVAYADQTEKDHKAFAQAVRQGRLPVLIER